MSLGVALVVLAAMPAALACVNLVLYRRPATATGRPAVSVLIPARNEAANIGEAVACVLASRGIELELIVLDDHSTDATPDILARIDDPRLRVATADKLPPGWSGKQHACAALARLARHDLMVFVDADVRLAPDAVARMAGFIQHSGAALGSGVPRQITRTWSEKLLIPLIHFMLLGFLPIALMRRFGAVSLGAGCGQLFIARRAAYEQVGGHTAIRASLHDGITLPRAFRRRGFMTGLFDATGFATCRMYDSAAGVWEGLTKNATEGMAKPVSLPIWTAILGLGQVVPLICLLTGPVQPALIALAISLALRLTLAVRFRQPFVSAILHPLGVAAMLVVQWAALLRAARGRPATWRGRAYPAQ